MTIGKMKTSHCLLFALLSCLQPVVAVDKKKESSVDLTADNFNEQTAGKTVFIKFYSPSCGHCQELAPKWDQMAKEWVEHDQGLVGAVDCSVEGKLCTSLKFTGLPTLLYGEPSASGVLLQEYSEDKTYEAMSEFAKTTLSKTLCSPVNLEACEEKERNQMMYFLSLGAWELGSVIKDKEEAIQLAKDVFDAHFQGMQSDYDALGTEHEIEKSRIKLKLKALKEIVAMRETE
jgi:thiol-disulfide isomerase/thioredoxin